MVWKDIEGYDGVYKISDNGNVFSEKSNKIIKTRINKGYEVVKLHKNGNEKNFFVHRLVAITFIPNPENKREVNHIDENKLNNSVNNLEWVTPKENANFGTRNQRIREWVLSHSVPKENMIGNKEIRRAYGKDPIKVEQIDKDTGEIIAIYPSISEAERKTGIKNSHICWCCKGKRKTAHGYKWKYAN